MSDHYSDGDAFFCGQPYGFRFGVRRLGDAPDADGPPDPPPEGPEVWCRSCQWSHPSNASCIYGKNQPREPSDA